MIWIYDNFAISTESTKLIVFLLDLELFYWWRGVFQLIDALIIFKLFHSGRTNLVLRKTVFFVHVNKNFKIKRIMKLEYLHLINPVNVGNSRNNFSDLGIWLELGNQVTNYGYTFDFKYNLTFLKISLIDHLWCRQLELLVFLPYDGFVEYERRLSSILLD